MLVRLENVCRSYQMGEKTVWALHGVSFSVPRGRFLAVMGPSGSGKSTLLNILGCLHKPSEGEYFLDGTEVRSLSDARLAKIRNRMVGFVFQSFNLFPRMSALSNVQVPLIYSGVSKKERSVRAWEVLEKVGLSDRAEHRPGELSGGQQQRVAIARALVTSPSILLADEPTGNLDSKSGQDIMSLFKTLNHGGMTVIMVTHQDSVADFASEVILLKDGKIESHDLRG